MILEDASLAGDRNMTVELKRYRIAPLAVAGVSAAVMVLLGDRRMMEMVKKGMPKGGSVAVQNIWVRSTIVG